MPKISHGTGATYEGHTGLVENAHGVVFELDPTKNVDGSDRDGLDRPDDAADPVAVDGTPGVPSENTDAREAESESKDDVRTEDDGKDEQPVSTLERPAASKRNTFRK